MPRDLKANTLFEGTDRLTVTLSAFSQYRLV